MGRMLKSISRERPQIRAKSSWFLLHENVRSLSSRAAKKFLTGHRVVETTNPLLSQSCISKFFIFPTVKNALKGKRFQDAGDIKKNVPTEMKPLLTVFGTFSKDATNLLKEAEIALNRNTAIFYFLNFFYFY
jgi:hypothetical protein